MSPPRTDLIQAVAKEGARSGEAAHQEAPHAQVVAELKQLVSLCEGRLAAIRPLVEEALRVAGAGPSP